MARTKIVPISKKHSNIELRLCPFCGGDDFELLKYGEGGSIPHVCCVYCDTCGAEGPSCLSEESALAMWNKRAGDQVTF